jgi:hypothetical protein
MRITNDLFHHYFLDERDSNQVASRLISKMLSIDSKIKRDKKRERESNKAKRKSVRKFAIARPSAHESRARKTRESMRSDTSHVTKPSSAIGRKKVARTNQN